MRIIHDINGPANVCAGGKLYSRAPEDTDFGGWEADVAIFTADNGKETFDEAIYIEGDSKYVIQALKDALEQLESVDKLFKEEHEKKLAKDTEIVEK